MAGIVLSDYAHKQIVENIRKHSATGGFDGLFSPGNLTLRLFKSAMTLTHLTVLTDFTEADFTGYTALTPMTFLGTYQDGTFNYTLESDLVQFLQTASTVTNSVYGYYIETSADSGNLVCSEMFPAPIQMSGPDKAVNLSIRLQLGPNTDLGTCTVVG